jgi:hypothetical protein
MLCDQTVNLPTGHKTSVDVLPSSTILRKGCKAVAVPGRPQADARPAASSHWQLSQVKTTQTVDAVKVVNTYTKQDVSQGRSVSAVKVPKLVESTGLAYEIREALAYINMKTKSRILLVSLQLEVDSDHSDSDSNFQFESPQVPVSATVKPASVAVPLAPLKSSNFYVSRNISESTIPPLSESALAVTVTVAA